VDRSSNNYRTGFKTKFWTITDRFIASDATVKNIDLDIADRMTDELGVTNFSVNPLYTYRIVVQILCLRAQNNNNLYLLYYLLVIRLNYSQFILIIINNTYSEAAADWACKSPLTSYYRRPYIQKNSEGEISIFTIKIT